MHLTKKSAFTLNAALILICSYTSACQKKPAVAPSADSMSAIEPPPMGATTYNDELKKEINILTNLLDGQCDQMILKKVRDGLMTGNTDFIQKERGSYESHLAKVLLTLPELVHQSPELTPNRKLWLIGKYYFLKRRFVEAAMKMTEVLQKEPKFVEARNWRARAIFFLGNPDLAISELNGIIAQSAKDSSEQLDALYLVGAIVYESNDTDVKRLNTGIDAWEKYLKVAEPNSAIEQEVKTSIAELRGRREGPKTPPANLNDPFLPNEKYGPEKNAILVAFAKEELKLALDLADLMLTKSYDKVIAVTKARILFKTGLINEAAQLFESIVTKDPEFAVGYHYQGMAFMLKGDPKSAAAAWTKALGADRSYAEAHGLPGRIAVAQKMVAANSGS